MNLRSLKGGAVAIAIGLASITVTSASADQIKLFSPVSEKRPSSAHIRDFAAKAAELSGDSLAFEISYPGSLGIEVQDLLRHLKRGFVGAAAIYGPYYNRDAPEIAAAYVEGAIRDFAAHEKAVPIITDLYAKIMAKWDIEYIGFVQPPLFDVSIFCREPASTLKELRSKKFRVWTAHQLETFTRLGVSAQIIPQSELYVAWQTGVIDCGLYLGEVAPLMSFNEVAPYESYMLPFASVPVALGVSKKTMNELDSKDQQAIRDAGAWISKKSLEIELDGTLNKEERRAGRIEKGFIQEPAFSDADVAEIVTAAREVWLEMATKAGSESLAAYELLTK